jgi:hypothetical protein
VAKKAVSFESTFTVEAADESPPPGCSVARHAIRTAVIKSAFLNMAFVSFSSKFLL